MLQVGSILDRKYKILSEIGHGGMSVVYLAINERAGKTWAVKEVRKEGVIDAQANLAGLVAETNLLKELHHKNLPSIIDVIDTEDSFIIVMDYIEGKDLKKILETEGAQSPEAVRKWGIQICDVLGYLHSQHPPIIYRDMKPANLMLKPAGDAEDGIGDISLIDFGTARKYKDTSQIDDTKPLGTIGYAAPEQYGNQGQTDARTDIYTVGATLFHLLTGISPADPPFYGVTLLRNVDPAYEDTGWEYVINKCCQQKREDRYQSCDELRYDLEHLDELSRGETVKRKRRWTLFLMSIALCVLGGIGMFAFNSLRSSAATQTYDQYLATAVAESDISAARAYYKRAIQVDPANITAYERLVEAIQSDGVFSSEESGVLSNCLLEKNDGTLTNEDYLRTRNYEGYCNLYYDIGVLHFFMRNPADAGIKDSGRYFEAIRNSETLPATKRNLAESLYNISKNYNSLDSSGNIFVSDYTYSNMWDDLCEMVEGNVSERVGRPAFAVSIYNQMAYQIYTKCKQFREYGITSEQMLQELDLVESGLNSITGQAALEDLKTKAFTMLENARNAVATNADRRG